MYNKCDKCGKMLTSDQARRLVIDQGRILTRCLGCYESMQKLKR